MRRRHEPTERRRSIRRPAGGIGGPRAARLWLVAVIALGLSTTPVRALAAASTTTPSLTKSFPLGTRRLSPSRDRSGARPIHGSSHTTVGSGASGRSRRLSPTSAHGGSPFGLLAGILGPLVVLATLIVALAWAGARRTRPRSQRLTRRPRPRREAPTLLIRLLAPVYRYSRHRNAYVPRVVGNRYGPVLVRREGRAPAPRR